MRRRDFITLLGMAALARPLKARAQQGGGMRRIGVLFGLTESDPETRDRMEALREGMEKLGWTPGRNIEMDYRFGGGDGERLRAHAA